MIGQRLLAMFALSAALAEAVAQTRLDFPPMSLPPNAAPIFDRTVHDPVGQRLIAYDWWRQIYYSTPSGQANWTQMAPIPNEPPRRLGAAFIADPRRGRIVLFGGQMVTPFQDTWEYDGTRWQQQLTATSPPPSPIVNGCFDERRGGVVVLCAFRDANGVPMPQHETWRYDGSDWRQLVVSTAPLLFVPLAADSRRGALVAFSGSATFELGAADWQQVTTTGNPTQRLAHGMAYDPRRERVVLFSGRDPVTQAQLTDFWEYDGATWRLRVPVGQTFGVRYAVQMHWDPAQRAVVGVGGSRQAGSAIRALNDVFLYRPTVDAESDGIGAGCPQRADVPPLLTPSLPWLGGVVALDVALPQNGWAVFVLGLSDTVDAGQPLPRALANVGLPGCLQRVSAEATVFALPVGGVASVRGSIPQSAVLLGQRFFAQAVVEAGAGPGVTEGRRLVVGSE